MKYKLIFLPIIVAICVAQVFESRAQKNYPADVNYFDSLSFFLRKADHYKYINTDSIIKYADLAAAFATQHHMHSEFGYALISRSYADLLNGNYKRAEVNCKKADSLFSRFKNEKGLMYAYRLYGVIYGNTGDYFTAQDFNYKALRIAEKQKDTAILGNLLNNMGILYYYQNNFNKALTMHLRVLRMNKGNAIDVIRATTYTNIAIIYCEQHRFDKAVQFFDLAVEWAKATNNLSAEGMAKMNLGEMYYNMRDYEKSQEMYLEALAIFQKYKMNINLSNIYGGIGNNYLKMQKDDDALKYYQLAVDNAIETGDAQRLRDTYGTLSNLYAKKGQYKESYTYLKQYNRLTDSLSGGEIQTRIAQLEKLYETEKKDNEIKQLILKEFKKQNQLDMQTRRIAWLIAGISVFFILLAILFFQNRKLQAVYKKLVIKNLELMQKESDRSQESAKALSQLAVSISDDKKVSQEIEKRVEPLVIVPEPVKEEIAESDQNEEVDDPERPKYAKSLLTDEQKQEILQKVLNSLKFDKKYLNPDLSIDSLADDLGIYRKYVSQVVNEKLEKNFTMLVNEYRVREARNLMVNPEFQKYTLEAIGQAVGFNSKSSFNTAFKKFTGITPSFFRETAGKS